MSRASVVVVGDALLDRDLVGTSARLCPDAPAPVIDDPAERIRPGGAALAAVLAACDGRPVTFVTALGDDSAGHLLAASLADAGVSVLDLGLDGPTPEKVRIRSGAQTLARLDRGSAPAEVRSPLTNEVRAVLAEAACVLVSDYGRGLAAKHDLRDVLARRNRRPVVWDPHPRGAQPVNGVLLATPNEAEAALFSPAISGSGLVATSARARDLARRWSARGVCVTRGAAGAVLSTGAGHPLVLAPPAVDRGDACGAGDRFAAAAACSLADGAVISEAVADAVAAARSFVADGGASSWEPPSNGDTPVRNGGGSDLSVDTVVAKTRARGGTVVATGGCFDLLHAGHVSFLTAARRLGDCLVVLMNSDGSVRRLKGPGRPIVAQGDRARVLAALASVDAVAVFDESTPVRALQRIRPDVFAKGGDYGGQDLPEGDALAAWGGEVVVLPYLEGRSTSRLVRTLEEVRTDG